MFGHRSFLIIGGGAADITSLIKGGHEISHCNFSFEQGIDYKGKITSRVYGGTLYVTLSQLPPTGVIEWALQSRKYTDGMIVVLDAENIPFEKILFQNAACVGMDVDYTQKGQSYTSTKLVIQAEKIIVGNGIDFDNEWTFE
ncbi:MAG: type VI secretion system needle protein Hcp [Candidatus Symbiothrix sp.]|jgi:hypothetical protein|nr:type VI secretion system needle protein Hcp [Candidatus Symbiothrix sp.]